MSFEVIQSSLVESALIAAVRGGPGTPAADVLTAFALRRKAEGVRIVGVIVPPEETGHVPPHPPGNSHGEGHVQDHGGHPNCECRSELLDIATGDRYAMHQNLGSGSQACNLNSSSLALASGAVERAIAQGPELVVLSRFGGQEATRGGLMAAFQAAVAAGVPVACVVTPKADEVWADFAQGLSVSLPAEGEALDAWWRAQARGRHAA
ncbi:MULTISPECIES: DUF2478 domain-containing protein [Rhodopseudomonas]|uniref:DUF2478 domain-containing protein n=1 Tax=Rhodopseudomonas palustris TaxID=1076 RepID=A0A0D7EYN0_RHOPL|nr:MULTISPECIES: DUF2478 domain-containing protein [Rhodopseudomonas]KIZ44562.1 hypothetical protein OO17_09600 [Rhodopseudomonas palustris]MDF3812938.1 DUF2478 domain-containing protein [Rhodopseudomonas sp. BAL398]WOK16019.1 DUF2478 domain-containing protein [Rhodopseudomonas sp. BAL398]